MQIDGLTLTHLSYNNICKRYEDAANHEKVKNECQKMGLEINKKKTEIMCNGYVANKSSVMIENEETKKMEKLVYLEQVINPNTDFKGEIPKRIQLAWTAFSKSKGILNNHAIPISLKKGIEPVYSSSNNDIRRRNVGPNKKTWGRHAVRSENR